MTKLRFDIEDRKGLEIVLLTALLTFQDSNESYHTPPDGGSTPIGFPLNRRKPSDNSTPTTLSPPPPPPPKPAPKTGIDRLAELQAIRGEYNEVAVDDEGSINDYAQYCCNLLEVRQSCWILDFT